MKNELVSIIIPCYNQAQYLADTLDSVLAQTYPYWECIIVNDGSLDDSENVALKYCKMDERFSYFFKQNSGPSETRNFAIEHSSGIYILPLDADDKIGSTYIEKAVKYFQREPETKLVYCLAELFGNKNEYWDLPSYNYNNLLVSNHIFCSAIYRKLDFEKTDGYNRNMIYGFEDWDFWVSFLNPNDYVHRIEEVLFYYRIKDVSRSTELSWNEIKMREQILLNHPTKYLDLLERISDVEDYKGKYDQLRLSKAYRLGKFLLKPFSKLKALFNNYHK